MLNRRYKRRYIGIYCGCMSSNRDQRSIFQSVLDRNSELFGYIFNQTSYIKLTKKEHSHLIVISCRTESLDQVLISLTFLRPAVIVVDVSGSIRKLKTRWAIQYASFLETKNQT
jgi:RNase P/RNase MRP subunit POP5